MKKMKPGKVIQIVNEYIKIQEFKLMEHNKRIIKHMYVIDTKKLADHS